jgi:hypothetical protein
MWMSLVEKSSKPVVEFNFYKRIRLLIASVISSGGFIKKTVTINHFDP